MREIIKKIIYSKKVLILGFGKEGKSTLDLIQNIGGFSELAIADQKYIEKLDGVTIHCGDRYLDILENYDIVFKSPGIVLPKNRDIYSCYITSQTELFLYRYGRQTIGITGTKGKSTVSSLIYHILSNNSVNCVLAGNIGKPVFDILSSIDYNTIVVLELSCHQLEYCNFSPSIAVLLNLYEDHLDHYGTFERYINAKKNIYSHQSPLDTIYYNEQLNFVQYEAFSRKVPIRTDILPFSSLQDIGGIKLQGTHNLFNCAVVYSISKIFNIADDAFIDSLRSFIPLQHRLEFIGIRNNVYYYDDSISTTVESTISAIESIPNTSTIVLGGMDRGIQYSKLVSYLLNKKIHNIICMYESGRRIYEMLKSEKITSNIYYCEDLYDATKIAIEITEPYTSCILSPASASYGNFKNFAERGNVFKSLIFS